MSQLLTVKTSILNVYTKTQIVLKKQNILEYISRELVDHIIKTKQEYLSYPIHGFRVGKSSISVLSIMLGKTKRYIINIQKHLTNEFPFYFELMLQLNFDDMFHGQQVNLGIIQFLWKQWFY